jgi:hypothetical protein
LVKQTSLKAPLQENISVEILARGLDIYIMEKDSKKFYIYNTVE